MSGWTYDIEGYGLGRRRLALPRALKDIVYLFITNFCWNGKKHRIVRNVSTDLELLEVQVQFTPM